ncbi:efflux ABC transporter, permease/ATP-binding protein [Myxococcus xanthus DK 1622]|uniref:Efflux ABC transporter, permease/ATP-binding protein n=1 Tax=Myxococcus xanthus (strain DK1622) TaxID=246197 RepID=Q1DDB6_MYXXD|nr:MULTISPECIES: ABC transporter transmembrane domain-containing protein [Myxococcus]ABF91337.1 efflux ABC transporter, permease/ATP-binding protein [Myxococcus xanthus DK 1622]NOJ57797.1 ATP-binding cassette domain-containing protein [Myxococcus xanthus]QPM80747.1 ATP-binding cassette domain-containing protein [Myxococcus xanthus]QVW69808.1 ATP-binding cassette domain-containing protein [Myxococcus xanthus DZ2]QZZ48622.1 putative ABC transporter ATP-binding protein [Myxococcus xanthus]
MSSPANDSKSSASPGVTVRRLLKLARPELLPLAAGTLFLLISSGATLAYPRAIGDLVDQALTARDRYVVDRLAMLMLAVFTVQGIAMALRIYLFTNAGERVVSRLRKDLFRALLSQEVGFFDSRRTGELTSRLSSDTTVLQTTVTANVSMMLRYVVTALGGVGLLLYTSVQLTLVMLAVIPPVAIGGVFYGRRVRVISRQAQDALAASGEVAEEDLSGIRTVRSFAAERHEVERYSVAVERSFTLAKKRALQTSVFMGVASIAGYGSIAAVLWYGGRLVVEGGLSVGELTSFLIYTMLVAFSFSGIAELWADFMRASGAAERVFELLDRKPAIGAGGEQLTDLRGHVQFRGVHFAYPSRPDVPVLQGLDLELRPGEVVAVVGPSGAGKSTLASLLSRFYDPQNGEVLLDGHPLTALEPEWLRRNIGMVAQEPQLFSCSIADNIRYGRPGATDAQVEEAARAANAHAYIERFPEGYGTQVGERGVQLSGGQKQRVAIARAVLKDPRLLILDEATSALDAESEHLVKDALERLMKGRTTLIIAHRLSTVANADRVLVLDGGVVIQSGTHASLMSQEGLYRRLVERQFVAA